MNKELIGVCLIGMYVLFPLRALAEIIYPILSKNELQSVVGELNKQKIKMSDWYNDEDINPGSNKAFEKVESVSDNGEFFIEGVNGGFKFFKVDINNDGRDEYVKTLEVGSGRFFDIEAVYQKVNGKFVDLYDELRLPMRKAMRDAEGATYDLGEGYVGHAFGDIVIEKTGGKIYFTILEGRAQRGWEDLNSFNVSDRPTAYEFLWRGSNLSLLRSYQRLLRKSDFFKKTMMSAQ